MSKIKIEEKEKEKKENNSCCICWDEMASSQKLKTLPCLIHQFIF
jgi:hypothetical protein